MAPTGKKTISLDEALAEMDKIQVLVAQMEALLEKSANGTNLVAETRRSLSVVRAALESRREAQLDEWRGGISTGKRKRAGGAANKRGTRRRRSQSCRPLSVIISDTLADGHTWRKYGQKAIYNSNFPKSYYRCTHKNTRNCLAGRQVQRKEDDPSTYTITYIGEHTCKNTSSNPGLIARDVSTEPEQPPSPSIASHNQEIPLVTDMPTTPSEETPLGYWPDMDPLNMTSLPMTTQSPDGGGSEVGDVTSMLHAECPDYMGEELFNIFRLYFDGDTGLVPLPE